jgi:hypothetical protein
MQVHLVKEVLIELGIVFLACFCREWRTKATAAKAMAAFQMHFRLSDQARRIITTGTAPQLPSGLEAQRQLDVSGILISYNSSN